ncbi:MAG: TonB-dependent receptor [Bacteroidales bacterium]|nr:TonB-dependent receptor [Bacteroidales bacterium]
MRIKLLLITLLFLVGLVQAQETIVTGKVTEHSGEPLPGATVVEKGTSNGTITNVEGIYTIAVSGPDAILEFSYVGYLTEQEAVAGNNSIDKILLPDIQSLEEVVLIGYGTVKKKDLTGAVSVINTDDLKNSQVLTVGDAIQGLAAGVTIRSNGNIGSEPDIKIRGVGNFGNHNPLYVIDDIIVAGGIRDLNVNDIESVQILKDASAAAIYGNRAANGVIIITTKRGSSGDMKVDFSMKYGIDKLPSLDLMDTTEFFFYNDMAYRNAGLTPPNHFENNTDWEKEVLRTGYSKDYNLSISGGNDKSRYLMSAGYYSINGTSIGTSMDRISFRVNSDAKRGPFTIGENISITNTSMVPSSDGNPVASVMRMLPDMPVYDSANPGGYGYGNEARARTFGTNPIAVQNLVNNKSGNMRLRGNVFGELSFLKYFKYRMNVGYETSFDQYKSLRKVGNWTLNQPFEDSYIYENRAQYQSILYDNILSFDRNIDAHSINLVVGSSYQHESYNQISGKNSSIFVSGGEYIDVLNGGSSNPVVAGFKAEIYRISYFGRLNYDYQGKYLFSATLRRDATSQFGPDYRTGYFPSVSAAWRLSKENFFAVDWISDLKIRANYGELGNASFENWGQNSGIYDYIPSLTTFPMYYFSTENIVTGATQRKLVNPDLTWETKKQSNFGADWGLWGNQLIFSADYYISKTEDVLVAYPILYATGNDGGDPWVNAGTLQNNGFDFELSWRKSGRDFNYSVSANLTTINNKVIDLPYGDNSITTGLCKSEVGRPLAMFYLIKTDGIFQSEGEVLAHKNSKEVVIQPNAKPGDIRYIDYNDDGLISDEDRQYAGSPWPVAEVGLNFSASYKQFDVSVQGFGSFGQKVWNGTRAMTERFNDNSNYRKGINPWTPENTNTDFPRVLYGDERNSRSNTDRWIEDGSFFRLRNISLGYNLSIPKTEKLFDNIRLAVSVQNLATLTKYEGLDAEFSNGNVLEFGVDGITYPSPTSILFSINAKF